MEQHSYSTDKPSETPGTTDKPDALSALVIKALQTQELRELLGTAAPELVKAWAGSSRIKQAVAGAAGASIQKGMKKDAKSAKEFSALLDDPEFMASAADALPGLISGLIDAACKFGIYLENLPPQQRLQVFERLVSASDIGRAGQLCTVYSRVANGLYAEDPRLLTHTLTPAIREWIEQTDFGELRDTLEHATGDIMELISRFWMLMRQYPAKVVTLLSIMPNFANIAVYALKETAGNISGLFQSPDMITDFLLSVMRRIDGKAAGELINTLCELSRQMHVGSGLLGEPGSPVFRRDLSALLDDIIETVDPEVFNKARLGLAEGRQTVCRVLTEKLRNDPEKFIAWLHATNEIRNIRIKTLSEKTALVEDTAEAGGSRALFQSIAGLNTHDLAEMVNSITRTINRIRQDNEGFDVSAISEFANGVDTDELREAVKWLSEEIGELIRPLGRALAPHLVQMICEWAAAENDGFDPDVGDAVDSLKNLLASREKKA